MVSIIVILLFVVLMAFAGWWFARMTGSSDFNERYTKYQEKSDELSRTLSLTYVCCKKTGCRHLNEKGKCMKRTIVVDPDGKCKDSQ